MAGRHDRRRPLGKSKTAIIICMGYSGAWSTVRTWSPSTKKSTRPVASRRRRRGSRSRRPLAAACRSRRAGLGRGTGGCPDRRPGRSISSPNTSKTQISPERSGSSSMPTIQADAIERAVRSIRARTSRRRMRRPSPLRRLHLAHAEPVAERLLANRAASLTGEHARLDARDAQRPVMLDGAPQALPGRDRQPQLRPGDLVRCRALSTRTPLRQVVRDPYRAIEVAALEVVAEAHGVSLSRSARRHGRAVRRVQLRGCTAPRWPDRGRRT